jgi:hypothetical protein
MAKCCDQICIGLCFSRVRAKRSRIPQCSQQESEQQGPAARKRGISQCATPFPLRRKEGNPETLVDTCTTNAINPPSVRSQVSPLRKSLSLYESVPKFLQRGLKLFRGNDKSYGINCRRTVKFRAICRAVTSASVAERDV